MVFPLDRQSPSGPKLPPPSGAGGAILAIGEGVNSPFVQPAGASFPGFYIEEAPGVPLEVSFPAWTKGDVLTIEWWAWAQLAFDFASLQWGVNSEVDVGSGFQMFVPGGGGSLGGSIFQSVANTSAVALAASISIACDVAPRVRLRGFNVGGDPFSIVGGALTLRCMRSSPAAWIKGPAGVLL